MKRTVVILLWALVATICFGQSPTYDILTLRNKLKSDTITSRTNGSNLFMKPTTNFLSGFINVMASVYGGGNSGGIQLGDVTLFTNPTSREFSIALPQVAVDDWYYGAFNMSYLRLYSDVGYPSSDTWSLKFGKLEDNYITDDADGSSLGIRYGSPRFNLYNTVSERSLIFDVLELYPTSATHLGTADYKWSKFYSTLITDDSTSLYFSVPSDGTSDTVFVSEDGVTKKKYLSASADTDDQDLSFTQATGTMDITDGEGAVIAEYDGEIRGLVPDAPETPVANTYLDVDGNWTEPSYSESWTYVNDAVDTLYNNMPLKGNDGVLLFNNDVISDRWLNSETNTVFGRGTFSNETLSHTTGTTGYSNSAFGYQVLKYITTGEYNTAIGAASMLNTTIGTYNVSVGTASMLSNIGGFCNVSIGSSAMYNTTNAGYNVGIGYKAMYSNIEGENNIAIGREALYSNKDNDGSTAVGYQAMYYADDRTVGERNTYNTAVGYQALFGSSTAANNTGQSNNAFGYLTLSSNTSGSYNIAGGSNSLKANTTGSNNVGIGHYSLYTNSTGSNNVGIGTNSLQYSTAGNNVAIGHEAGQNISTGTHNAAIGLYSQEEGTSAFYNTSVGAYALNGNVTGDGNIAVGYKAGTYNTALSNRIYIGSGDKGSAASDSTETLIYGNQDIDKLTINGEQKVTGDVTANGYAYTDPSAWMASFRQAPFYYNDFLYNNVATLFPWYGAAIYSGTTGLPDPEYDHPGMISLKSSTSANSGYRLMTASGYSIVPQGEQYMEMIFNPITTTNVSTLFGFMDGLVTSTGEGYFISINGTTLQGETYNTAGDDYGNSVTGTTYTISSSTWYRAEVSLALTADTAFYALYDMDGELLWNDYLTTTVPDIGWIHSGVVSQHSGTAVRELIKIDYMAVYFGRLSR